MHSVTVRQFCIAAILQLLAIPTAYGQAPGYKARLDSFFNQLNKYDKSMCGVALYRAGKPVYIRNIGYVKLPQEARPATTEGGAPVAAVPGVVAEATSAYHIGSISKVYTATMILQLIDEQKLQPQTKLSAFFPSVPEAEHITVDMLLHHRTGIYNFTTDPTFGTWEGKLQTTAKMLERVAAYPRDFKPGEKHEYSNTNYLLLGYIIEQLDGTDYGTALAKRITGPLKLQHTRVYRAKNDQPGYVRTNSYTRDNKTWTYVRQTDPSTSVGAGSIEASPSDLCVFIQALITGQLTSDSMLRYMTATGADDYGAGIVPVPFDAHKGYGHNGRIDGFTAVAAYFPEDSLAVAITVNGQTFPANDIAIAMLSMYHGAADYEMPNFGGIALPVAALDAYTGTYHTDVANMTVIVRRDGDHLTAQATGQQALTLVAESKKRFAYADAGIILDFRPEADGGVKKFVLRQGGANILFTRE